LLRGVAVVIMVGAHVTDSWTREPDRYADRYFTVDFVNGLAAPLFLLLAGVAVAMASESRARREGSRAAAQSVVRHGWQIFGLAFLFRLQANLLGLGPLVNLLKVDILNVMGLALVLTAWMWGRLKTRERRIAAYAVVTMVFAALTPSVRAAEWLSVLPDPFEWYFRTPPEPAGFTLFPWAGFLTGGALIGELIDAAKTPAAERQLYSRLAAVAVGGAIAGYAASFLPSLFSGSWSGSPAFFAIRLGIVSTMIPLAWAAGLCWAPLVAMGRSSLFVYWIHVEMVYGPVADSIKRTLPLEVSILAALALCSVLYGLVLLKNAFVARRGMPRWLGILSPVLK
jgi:uncharacterized membrane protein